MVIAEVVERLTKQQPGCVACAPGRLDVMGGLAEYMGSRVVNMPLGDCGCVGAERISDERLTILSTAVPAGSPDAGVQLPWSKVQQLASMPAQAAVETVARQRPMACDTPCSSMPDAAALRCTIGTVVESLRERLVQLPRGGLFLVIGRAPRDGVDIGRDAARVASALAAIAAVSEVQLDARQAAVVCQRVENHWLGAPVGVGDAVCALVGKANALCEVLGDCGMLQDSIPLPKNVSVIGIDCGVAQAEAAQKYQRVRTAAFMGKALIERILEHDGAENLPWNGHLAQLPVTQFVDGFRDRLPTKLRGSEYLDRFGETGDPLTRIDPNVDYRIRSRTEHHVYEHERACQFGECLRRAAKSGSEAPLIKAGELMYASHWSYGQRCGLGSVETDFLVTAIRRQGLGAHIYGAKITGRGCGGSVAVLMRSTEKARAALEDAMQAYARKTGNEATLLVDSAPGALLRPAQRV